MYKRSAKVRVLPHLGNLRLLDVTSRHLVEWTNGLKADGVGARTVQVASVTCHKMFKSAAELGSIYRNPADNQSVRDAKPNATAPAPLVWTAEESRRFLESQREDRLHALYRLAATTGLRRGELAGPRWGDTNLDEGWLRVTRTRVVVDYKVIDSKPKTPKSRRVIGLDPATASAMNAHRRAQTEELFSLGIVRSDDGFVFVREDGEPYHPQRISVMLAARAKTAGLPVTKVHALRHAHATHALESGVPLKVVSERLGHSSIAITGNVYSHVSPAVDQAAATQVAAYLDGC
jgi:integrase